MKIFSRNKTISEEQQRLSFFIEKIISIAVVKTERGDNQSVIEILKDLELIFRKFWNLKKEHPAKFDALLWSKDFFENYVKPTKETRILDKDDTKRTQQAALLLSIIPEKELKGLTQFLDSFKQIWESAFRNENEEISRYVVYHLIWLLEELVKEPSNDIFIEEFLKLFNTITVKGIKSDKDTDASVFNASIQWYISSVFSGLRKENGFDLSYLELFNRYLFTSVKYIISQNQTRLFRAMVSSFVEGISIPTYYEGRIWDYQHLLDTDYKKYKELNTINVLDGDINELARSQQDLYSKEILDQWIIKFNKIKKILEDNYDEKKKLAAKKIEADIREYVTSQYKFNNLLELIFAVGAYCLFKKKTDYIQFLWEYKQPPDADASWVGHNIIPENLNDLIKFYFRKPFFNRKFIFWEDHHGSEIYYTKYFVLLLARIMQTIKPNEQGKYEQIDNFILPELHIYNLRDLQISMDGLIKLAEGISKESDNLKELGFSIDKIEETFTEKLIPFLKSLISKAGEQIKKLQKNRKISCKKVEDFKDQFLNGFSQSVILRDIFVRNGLYENKCDEEYNGKMGRVGIATVYDKAAFFDEWYVNYGSLGAHWGRDLALAENLSLLEDVLDFCSEIKDDFSEISFEHNLEVFKNLSEVIIISTNISVNRFFEKNEKFKPSWRNNSQTSQMKGLVGFYKFKNKDIPVFNIYNRKMDRKIMIFNALKLGQLIQYSPLDEGEGKESQKEIFYMSIQEFSHSELLINKFLEEPPEWLKKFGDKEEQKEYLKEKVLIKIFERYNYIKGKEFEGYLLAIT